VSRTKHDREADHESYNLDLTLTPAAIGGYDEIASTAERFDLETVVVRVDRLDDIIESKRRRRSPEGPSGPPDPRGLQRGTEAATSRAGDVLGMAGIGRCQFDGDVQATPNRLKSPSQEAPVAPWVRASIASWASLTRLAGPPVRAKRRAERLHEPRRVMERRHSDMRARRRRPDRWPSARGSPGFTRLIETGTPVEQGVPYASTVTPGEKGIVWRSAADVSPQ
jgi:hypothetical protein